MRFLVTGGTGFIGSHFVDYILSNTYHDVIILDRLDTTSTLDRLVSIPSWEQEKKRVKFVWWDLRSPINDYTRKQLALADVVVHFAASTHVDRSITDPLSFVMDNVVGTTNLLIAISAAGNAKKFIQFSTDEVMGSAPEGMNYIETDRCFPENPYAGSKLGAEAMVISFACTYRFPAIITRGMNVMGIRQHPEKFIPSTIRKVRDGETVIIHANQSRTKAGTRFYISAKNVSAALMYLIDMDAPKLSKEKRFDGTGIYNIVGEKEVSNLRLAENIAAIVGKQLHFDMVDFHSQRPGHDLRYSLDGSKLRNMGWKLPQTFEQSLEETVKWYLDNPQWLES